MIKYAAFILTVILTGCVISKIQPQPSGNSQAASVPNKGDFVELFNGNVHEGAGREVDNKHISIDGRSFHVKDIKSYQLKGVYRTTNRNGFMTRIVRGKINVYEQNVQQYSGTTWYSRTVYYLQKGDNAPWESFDINVLERMVSDNAKATEWIQKHKAMKKKDNSYINNAIETYNSN